MTTREPQIGHKVTQTDAPKPEKSRRLGVQNRRFPRPGSRVPSSTSSRYRVSRTRRVTCVTCVSCRACDVARDRSIGRVRSEGPEIVLWLRRTRRIFLLCSPLLSSPPGVSRVARTWACYFTGFLHNSNAILTILGEHGENIDPVC